LKAIEEINVFEVIQQNVCKRNEFVITPLNILISEGFPIADQSFVLNNKVGIQKIKSLLVSLEKEGWLTKRKSKQDFKGIKETAYNFVVK
jgi:hypothetical protein